MPWHMAASCGCPPPPALAPWGPGLRCPGFPDRCAPWLPQLFIGFGFPYEGPAPLEAIANGCVFLQARFSPPHSSLNHEFFRGKPTSREVSGEGLTRGPPHHPEEGDRPGVKGHVGQVGGGASP